MRHRAGRMADCTVMCTTGIMWDMQEREHAPGRSRPRLTTWFLLLLLCLVAWGLIPTSTQPERELTTIQDGPPPVVSATGPLKEVFESSRPATVRIESHCTTTPEGHRPAGIGTGFFIDESGTLLTAYHVVRAQQLGPNCPVRYQATASDDSTYDLELLAFDAVLDVALMKAELDAPVPWLPLSHRLPVTGSEVVAIGNSRRDFLQDRAGTVLRRNVTASQVSFASGTIETTASLAPGDSGGPLLNSTGEVLGVVSYISYLAGGTAEEQGLIPRLVRQAFDRPDYTSYAVPVLQGGALQALLSEGMQRDIPVIGFQLQFDYLPAETGGTLGTSPGVVVGPVQAGGPGDMAGLRSFERQPVRDASGRRVGSSVRADVIVAINGFATPNFDQLLALIYEYDVGDTVTLTVQRGGELADLPLTLAGRRDIFP